MIPLVIPVEVLKQHLVVLGKTGSGKSTTLRHMVEWLLLHDKRVCIIDPKGDWWGLKWSADGKKPGFPVIAFGDFKERKASDIPINPQAGKQVAELIVSGNRPCIIGLRGWMPGELNKFWVNFASTIFNSNEAGGLYIIIDEIQNFAPKERVGGGEENIALHWTKRLLSEGRGLGLTIMCGSQRPQSVHNGVLTQCETLIGMRVTHDADCSAVETWLKRCRDKEKRTEIMSSIPEMARGEAWVWSPEIGFGPKRINFPLFETFDSFAPPQLQKKIHGSGWATVNIEEVKVKLATVIEEQKLNDPGELKKKIAELNATIIRIQKQTPVPVAAPPPPPPPPPEPYLTMSQEGLLTRISELCGKMHERMDTIGAEVKTVVALKSDVLAGLKLKKPAPAPYALHGVTTGRMKSSDGPNLNSMPTSGPISEPSAESISGGALGKCANALLRALAPYKEGRNSKQLGVLAGYSSKTGGFANALSDLRKFGYIYREQPLRITPEGKAYLGNYEELPKGQALHTYWMNRLSKCEKSILTALIEVYPNKMTKAELSEVSGYSSNTGGFANSLSTLRTLELIDRGSPIKASDNLFQ